MMEATDLRETVTSYAAADNPILFPLNRTLLATIFFCGRSYPAPLPSPQAILPVVARPWPGFFVWQCRIGGSVVRSMAEWASRESERVYQRYGDIDASLDRDLHDLWTSSW
jgi:hypothetical protein